MTCFPLQFSRLARTSIGRSAAPVRSGPPLETAIAPPRERRKDRQPQRQSSLSVMNAGDQACPETRPCPHPSPGDRKPARTLAGKADGTDVLLGSVEFQHRHAAQLNTHAKGRIERLFETLQDRLVKEMRLAGIDSIQGANHFLEMRFLPEWEQRFTVAARNPRNAHRRLGREQHLEEILSVRVARKVAQDHTVSWDGNRWGMLREEVCAGLRGAAVEIERRLDGSHWLRYRGRYVHLRPCQEPVRPSASPSGLRPPGLAEQTPKPQNKIKPKYHVPANHPWRKPWKRTFLSGEKPDISTLR